METENQLSYSSASLLTNCEQRYTHYKVLKTKVDDDIEENNDALVFGSAFHEVLENTKHTSQDIKIEFNKVKHKYMLDSQTCGVLEAALMSYLTKHAHNPFRVIACELEIKTETYLGYIDAIAANDEGEWLIVDLKTASKLFGALDKKLPDDFQLNIYTYYKEELAKQLDLDVDKFLGCSYRVTLKSKLKQKKTEDRSAYMNRLLSQCISYDFFIEEAMMNPDKFGELHSVLYEKARMLREGKMKPIKNYNYCEAFFRPCPYWSQCHTKKWSDESTLQI